MFDELINNLFALINFIIINEAFDSSSLFFILELHIDTIPSEH
jgi:hypothetical protein